MIYQDSVLVQLIRLVDRIPTPKPPPQSALADDPISTPRSSL